MVTVLGNPMTIPRGQPHPCISVLGKVQPQPQAQVLQQTPPISNFTGDSVSEETFEDWLFNLKWLLNWLLNCVLPTD